MIQIKMGKSAGRSFTMGCLNMYGMPMTPHTTTQKKNSKPRNMFSQKHYFLNLTEIRMGKWPIKDVLWELWLSSIFLIFTWLSNLLIIRIPCELFLRCTIRCLKFMQVFDWRWNCLNHGEATSRRTLLLQAASQIFVRGGVAPVPSFPILQSRLLVMHLLRGSM